MGTRQGFEERVPNLSEALGGQATAGQSHKDHRERQAMRQLGGTVNLTWRIEEAALTGVEMRDYRVE
jgi:hypothetical protein